MKPYPFEEVKYSTRPLRGLFGPGLRPPGHRNLDFGEVDLRPRPHVLRRGMVHAVFIDVSQHILETAAAGAHALLLFLLLVLTFGLL